MGIVIAFVISLVVSLALAPKAQEPKPASLEEIDAPTAETGRAIPVVFGTVILKDPNIVWYGDLKTAPIKKGGKK